MITVIVRRKIRPGKFQEMHVELPWADRLWPRVARAAIQVAFDSNAGAEVWWTDEIAYQTALQAAHDEGRVASGNALPLREQYTFGYRVYPNSARKLRAKRSK